MGENQNTNQHSNKENNPESIKSKTLQPKLNNTIEKNTHDIKTKNQTSSISNEPNPTSPENKNPTLLLVKNPDNNFGQFNDYKESLSETSNTSLTKNITPPLSTTITPLQENINQPEGPSSADKKLTCEKELITPPTNSPKLQ